MSQRDNEETKLAELSRALAARDTGREFHRDAAMIELTDRGRAVVVPTIPEPLSLLDCNPDYRRDPKTERFCVLCQRDLRTDVRALVVRVAEIDRDARFVANNDPRLAEQYLLGPEMLTQSPRNLLRARGGTLTCCIVDYLRGGDYRQWTTNPPTCRDEWPGASFGYDLWVGCVPTYVGVAPAIGNAVFHATGRRVRHLPIHIEDLLA